ncbi:ATP-binding protein [Rhodoglobus aureus]|uniref:Schlafen AlbA-2 domain-containing protein n=1 Tax=Rhodoglobus aureus TaxID=191497 RepID=A0ABN1VK92_9MICO
MEQHNFRFDGLRPDTEALFRAGEQPHIEFKSQMIQKELAKQVAAGANYVAFLPSAKVHTILFGVAEKDDESTGVTAGEIIGLFSDTGAPARLDDLQLQIEQSILGKIQPKPDIVLYQENTSSLPILVLEIRPTTPPHIVDDRWVIRGTMGVRAMTQSEALKIFKLQRLSAWIDEFEESDPLRRALAEIRNSIEDFRFEQFASEQQDRAGLSDEFESRLSAKLLPIERMLAEAIQESGSVAEVVADVRQIVEGIADRPLEFTAEQAWFETLKGRQLRLNTINRFATLLGAERVGLLDELFVEFLGATAEYSEFAENSAEIAAYRRISRIDDELSIELAAASDLVVAALWRRNGVPPFFGLDWLADVRRTEDILVRRSAQVSAQVEKKLAANESSDVLAERGILNLPGVSVESMIEELGGVLSLNKALLNVRTPRGVYWLAIPKSNSVWPIGFFPAAISDDVALEEPSVISTRILMIVERCGGASWRVEGPGAAIPTS